jgi:hypothetical protein
VEASKAAVLTGYVVEMEGKRSWRTGVAYRSQVTKEETGSRTGQLKAREGRGEYWKLADLEVYNYRLRKEEVTTEVQETS